MRRIQHGLWGMVRRLALVPRERVTDIVDKSLDLHCDSSAARAYYTDGLKIARYSNVMNDLQP